MLSRPKKRRQPAHDATRLIIDAGPNAGSGGGRGAVEAGIQKGVRDRRQHEREAAEDERCRVAGVLRDMERADQDRGQHRAQRSGRMPGVDRGVVPRHRPGAPFVRGGGREECLLQCRGGTPVAAHAVHHGQGGDDEEGQEAAGKRDRHVAEARQRAQRDQRPPPSPGVRAQAGDDGASGAGGHAGGDHEPDTGRREAAMRQVDGDQHAREAHRGGAETARGAHQRGVASQASTHDYSTG